MKLILQNGLVEAVANFEDRHALKGAGFRWKPELRRWWTDSAVVAANFRGHADKEAGKWIDERIACRDEAIAASRAATADVEIPAPEGLEYLPFQKAGIAYAQRQWQAGRKGVLIGDDMGLGKTIQAIGLINAEPIRRVLVVCPASLKLNWERELQKWLTKPLTIAIANGNLPATDIVILNYDVLKKHRMALVSDAWDLVVVDECHYIKNGKAQRTQALLGDKGVEALPAARWLFLTGTPILNRPVELWNVCRFSAPDEFRSWHQFVTRYCGGHQTRWGWDVSGAANLDELQERLRALMMVRRRKADVLTELPAKRRQVITLAAEDYGSLLRREMEAWGRHEEMLEEAQAMVNLADAAGDDDQYTAAVARLRDISNAAFTEMSLIRHELALAKVPAVLEHMENIGDEKVVLFAHHHDVIAELMAGLEEQYGSGCAVKLTGEMTLPDRQASVDRFQTDKSCRFFVGSIMAAGVGLTLTAASHVVFAELDWVPGNLTQAEDRCHRIGQTASVLVQHLVVDGSLDARMAHTLVQKQAWADEALDTEFRRRQLEVPTIPRPERERDEKPVREFTEDERAAILAGLRWIAGRCDGAEALDGIGFSKVDTMIGKSLARAVNLTPKQATIGWRLIQRYQRQVPAAILEAAGVPRKGD